MSYYYFQMKEIGDDCRSTTEDTTSTVAAVNDDDDTLSIRSVQSQPRSVTSLASASSTRPSASAINSRDKRSSTAEDDAILSSLEERSQQFLTIQKQLLDRLRPEGDTERDAFMDWLRSAVHNLEHSLWRRCQRELLDVMYRYIVENDALRNKKQSSGQPAAGSSSQPGVFSHTIPSGSYCQAQPNQAWQPGPQYWPATVQNPTSVWGSMDSSWVQQQFPVTQGSSQSRSQVSEHQAQFTVNQSTRAQSTPPSTRISSTHDASLPHFTSFIGDINVSDEESNASSATQYENTQNSV